MDLIISGTITKVITNKYRTSDYVLLLTNIKHGENTIEQAWVPFDGKRLAKLFFQLSSEEVELSVAGEISKGKVAIARVKDIVDDKLGRYESNKTYVERLLTGKKVQDKVKIGDIYFKINMGEKSPFSMGVIYRSGNNEVKMYCNGLNEWWTLEELDGLKNIYRVNMDQFKELADVATLDPNTYIEIYSESVK